MEERMEIRFLTNVLGNSSAEMIHQMLLRSRGWKWGQRSLPDSEFQFWINDLGEAGADPLLAKLIDRGKEEGAALLGKPVDMLRIYANGLTAGLNSEVHRDDRDEDALTLLYYPHTLTDVDGGETIFYDADGEIRLVRKPVQDTAVLFDSRILHVGRPPTSAFRGLRVTVALKLKASA